MRYINYIRTKVVERSTNSILNNPSFQQWFRGSKVVDDSDHPLVVYHGTKADITTFNTTGGTGKTSGTGLFLSDDPHIADTYTRNQGAVYPVYLNLRNPLVVDAYGSNWNALNADATVELRDGSQDDLLSYFGVPMDETVSTDDVALLARRAGHDGAIIRGVIDSGAKGSHVESTVFVAFSPNQIKSVFNQGGFSPNSDHISESDYHMDHRLGQND